MDSDTLNDPFRAISCASGIKVSMSAEVTPAPLNRPAIKNRTQVFPDFGYDATQQRFVDSTLGMFRPVIAPERHRRSRYLNIATHYRTQPIQQKETVHTRGADRLFYVFKPSTANRLASKHRQQQDRNDVDDLDHRVDRRARRIFVRVANGIAGHSSLMRF